MRMEGAEFCFPVFLLPLPGPVEQTSASYAQVPVLHGSQFKLP